MKFKLVCRHECESAPMTNTLEFEAEDVEETIRHMRYFLLGCTFSDELIDKYIDVE